MSDFDKEAERERLREKYEQDQEKRAATQRMSELLLQGATMTNSHCDACGDPIFRYDGQEFCPTCQADGTATDESEAASADAESGAAPPSSADSAGASETSGAETAEATADATPDDGSRERRTPPTAGGTEEARPGDDRVQELAREHTATGRGDQGQAADQGSPIEAARASLSRTLVEYARAAEETDDPRRAKELLGAAREAAETLAALR